MKTSESIAALVKALVAAQAEITNPAKDSDNPFYKSKYANLPDCIDATKPILTKNGLAMVQSIEGSETIEVVTRLCHVSGEWMEGTISMTPTKNDPQGAASASTYGRRYGLMAMLDIAGAEMDDDGGQASGTVIKKQAPPVSPKTEAAPISPPVENTSVQIPPSGDPNAPTAADPGPLQVIDEIASVKFRPVAKGGGRQFTVEFKTGRKASTFSETLALHAKALKEEGAKVVATMEQSKDGRFFDLTSVERAVTE